MLQKLLELVLIINEFYYGRVSTGLKLIKQINAISWMLTMVLKAPKYGNGEKIVTKMKE